MSAPIVVLFHRINRWTSSHLRATMAIGLVLLIGSFLFVYHRQIAQNRTQDSQIKGLSKALSAQQSEAARGGSRVVTPPTQEIIRNPSAATQTPSNTPSQPSVSVSDLNSYIGSAIASYYASHTLVDLNALRSYLVVKITAYQQAHPAPAGRNGVNGKDAPPVTPEQLADAAAAAAADWCSNHNNCQGPAGPGPTSDQMSQAFQQYCSAHNNCQTPPQPFSWTFTIPGDGVTSSDHTYTINCSWDPSKGYGCSTAKDS